MNILELKEAYDTNEDLKAYADKYGRKHGIQDPINILKCCMVQEYYLYLKNGSKQNYEYPN